MFHDQRHRGHVASGSASFASAVAIKRFDLTVAEIGGGCQEIQVEGELDLAVADRLQQAIDSCQADQILIGLESCQFIDSSGIAVIVNARRGEKSRIVIHSPFDQVLRVLDITGLTADGLAFADREQALSAMGCPVSS
jgi:anti-anti-sigma factor